MSETAAGRHRGKAVGDREKTAKRLLNASAEKFYDPQVDIDWDAPMLEGAPYLPEHRVSLYGTSLWDGLSQEQRLELGRHEAVSMVSYGIYAEVALMHLLLRIVAEGDPSSRHSQYTLTEIGDECRHSTMFGRFIGKSGLPAYRQPWLAAHAFKFISLIPIGPVSYGMALLIEEILDRGQRETMVDESLQPHMRMLNRIHVLEEARHISFAREELVRSAEKLNRFQLWLNRLVLAVAANGVTIALVNPRVYAAVGIRPLTGHRAAMNNPHYQQTMQFMAERMLRFFEETGMLKGRLIKALWRRSRLMPR
ncbi:AurF N-oxygenase family protein [Amycolatopsis nigrescens]|uniref:AurF N-oxygenase family protein n=1 Tax=Amycolatopsis nigrescens TaxID=381445 RepID=UPI000363DB32|nr:diiron oxygenase [Amycolatopsis nigrescens]